MKNNRWKPLLIGGGIFLVIAGLTLSVVLTFGKEEKVKEPTKNTEEVIDGDQVGTTQPADTNENSTNMVNQGKVPMMNKDNVLANPLIEGGNIISEEEWNIINTQVMGLLVKFQFQEANELLNEKVVGLSLDEMEFGEEINRLQFDVNHLSFMDGDNGLNEAESVDIDGILRIGKSMQDPERALIATLASPNELQLETILYEDSLIPASVNHPTIGEIETNVKEDPNAEWAHVMGVQYPEHQIDRVHFTLDGFPLTATVLKNKDGYYRVWNIYQAPDSKAPYQKKAFWREYYVKFPQASVR